MLYGVFIWGKFRVYGSKRDACINHARSGLSLIKARRRRSFFNSFVQDAVYKDVIEPLESVSINIYPTQRESVKELGKAVQVEHIRLTPC